MKLYSIVKSILILLTSVDTSQHCIQCGRFKKYKDNIVKCLKKIRLKIRLCQQRSRDVIALCLTAKAPCNLASPNSMPTFQDPRTSSCLCGHPYWGSLTSSPHPSKSCYSFRSSWSLIFPRKSLLDVPGPSHLPLI